MNDRVKMLQEKQSVARSWAYDALSRGDTAALDQANRDYDATIVELEAILGSDAHCADVDCDLFGSYSDCYKDRNGFRPRHHVTRKEVLEWLEWSRTAPWDDDEDFCVGSEDVTCATGFVTDEPLPYEEYEYLEGK